MPSFMVQWKKRHGLPLDHGSPVETTGLVVANKESVLVAADKLSLVAVNFSAMLSNCRFRY